MWREERDRESPTLATAQEESCRHISPVPLKKYRTCKKSIHPSNDEKHKKGYQLERREEYWQNLIAPW